MKEIFSTNAFPSFLFKRTRIRAIIALLAFFLVQLNASAVTKTSVATGNWSAGATWSPAGVPASGDNVIVHGGNVVTVDGAYTCNNLDIGDATAGVTTVTVSLTNSLTINGDLRINPNNKANTYTLAAGAGSVNVASTFSTWGTTNTNSISVSTGTITFTPAVTIANAAQNITFTGAGIINFNSNYTDNVNKLVTFAGCTANFAGNYMVGTTNESWAAKGTANFTGTHSISPNANITFNNIQMGNSASTTLNSGAGVVVIAGIYTLAGGSTFTANQNFEVQGNWNNNGGTYSGTNTVWMNGAAQTIGGTSSTTFYTLQMGSGNSAVTVGCTVGVNTNCNSLVFHSAANARTLTVSNGMILTVNGDVTLNQATAAVTNTLAVNGGTCTVGGNLNFTGINNTATFITKLAVTTGAFTLSGNVNWMANTAVATEVITTTSTGSITFNSPLTMGTGTGTLSATSTGTINFNGTTSTSFVFGGAATSPVFTTANGCTLNFKAGFTNNTNALTLAATSNSIFTGNGSFTANANVTFGNVQIAATDTFASTASTVIVAGTFTLANTSAFTANESFEVDGNWTNSGGTMAGSDTVTFNKTATIGGTASTSFQGVQIGLAANATNITITMNNNNTCTNLLFSAAANLRTLTISAGVTLIATGDLTMNQPSAALITNTLGVGAGVCTISGNLNFVGVSSTVSQIAKISITTGAFTVNGTVSWMANTSVSTEVITVTSTGSITFGSPLVMGTGTGTVSATNTGTINFNGTSSTSFVFGGAATAPVFTTTNGCKIYFANGFTNNTAAYTFAATSTACFSGNGAITPTTAINFGNLTISASDTVNTGALVIVKGNITLSGGSNFVPNQAVEIDGNWTNSGGTVNNGANAIQMNGTAQTIGGTSSTTFGTLQIGSANSAVTVGCTMNNTNTCTNLIFHAGANARTLTLSAGDTLTVTTTATMNQPTGAVINSLSVGAGVCNVTGNLVFSGASNVVIHIATVAVTSGTFNLSGTLTWMGNTAVATEVITVSTGNLIFGSSLTMGSGSGTLSVTSTGTISFNGASAPSFNFGGAATVPVFTTSSGCTLNFKNGFTNNTNALIITAPSTTAFTGTGTVTPNAAITFADVQINTGATLTLGGNISLVGNWTNSGTLTPNSKTVTFSAASLNTQIITRSGGETFYNLAASNAGAIVQLNSNVIVSNALTMSGPNFNLNSNTLQLGSGAGASLTYTAGIAYGGTWKRWFPVGAITSNSGSYYGLFPMGTSTDYRPVAINSTVNPTGAGYVMASHTDGTSVIPVSYTDNEAAAIQAIANKQSVLSTSGLTGGTYNLNVTFTAFANAGVTTDLKLETYTSSVMGSVGTSSATTGTVVNPTAIRTGLTMAQLSNTWVIGTKNKTTTPLVLIYYSRKTGNWSDNSANSTWSNTSGGAGASCNCIPPAGAYVVVSAGQTVTADVITTVDYVDINAGGHLNDNNTAIITVNHDVTMLGSGSFANTGTWAITGNLVLTATSVCTATGTLTVTGNTTIPSGGSFTYTSGLLTLIGNAAINGTISIGSGTYRLIGVGSTISGTGTIVGTSGATVTVIGNKTISGGSNLIFGSSSSPITFDITGAATVTNNSAVKIFGDLNGSAGASTWTNNAGSSLEVTGNLLSTGTLNASSVPNTVIYSGAGSQTVIVPAAGYDKLTIANGGVKTLGGSTTITDNLTIQDSAILDESTNALTGAAALSMSGTGELKMARSAAGTYPELTGTYSLTGGMVTINQTSGIATLAAAQYYNLKCNGTQAYDISGISKINSNLYMLNSSSITNNVSLTVTDSFVYATSGSSSLSNNISAGSFTISSGSFNDGGFKLTITGTGGWNNNGGTFTATGSASFSGSAAQSIGGSQSTSFNDLTLNNTFGVMLNVNPAAATVVSGALNMNKGILTTDSLNILRLLAGSTSTGGSAASYVDGPMVKVGADDFIFPTGNNGRWRRAAISGLTDPTTEVTARYFGTPYSDLLHETGLLYGVSPVEYWTINRAVSSDSLRLTLFWEGANLSKIKDCSKITIAHYKSNQWNEEHATAVSGSSCTAAGTGSIETTGFISSFSPFTFGGYTDDALPISLVSFDAVAEGTAVQTKWATRLELNNAYFTVERSADGETFNEVGKADGAGNSTSLLNYELTDESPLQGISYYRLRQTDFNGKFTYSNIVSVDMPKTATTDPGNVTIYPNPAHGQVSVHITKPAGQIQLKIFDVSGWELYAKNITVENSESEQTIIIPTGILPPGMYIVSTYTGQTQFKEKLVVQ